jgi:hypothetical protein
MSSSIISTITTTLTTTITTSNYTYNISQSEQPNSESGLSTAYIGLIVALIGLVSSCLVQYNIKTVKLCCVNIECNKKEEAKEEYMLPEDITMIPVDTILHTDPNGILTDREPTVVESSAILILADQEHTFTESTF